MKSARAVAFTLRKGLIVLQLYYSERVSASAVTLGFMLANGFLTDCKMSPLALVVNVC